MPGDLITPAELEARMRKHGFGQAVIERVLRLNPNGVHVGARVRGYYPSRFNSLNAWTGGWVSKGEFVRHHGREAWDALPNGLKYRRGRRKYLARETVVDNIHLVYLGKVKPAFHAHFPTKRYANDPQLVVEWVKT